LRLCFEYISLTDSTTDSPDKFANAPLALQILTPRWEDEKCIEVLKLVSKVVNSI
jgi:hypothetical protein